ATTASACARTISTPLQPRHSPLSPQWQIWVRRWSRATCSSDMSTGPAIGSKTTTRRSSGLLLALVHRVDLVLEVLLHDLALDVELEGQLALRLREVLFQQGEVLDRLPVADVLVHAVDGLLDVRAQPRLVEALLLSGLPVRHDQRRHVGPALADDHRALDQRVAHQPELERLRRDVLPDRRLEERLLAVGDVQEAFRVDLADVAGGDPAVLQGLGSGLGVLVVTQHVARALDQDLAVVRDLQLDSRERLAHAEEPMVAQSVGAGSR